MRAVAITQFGKADDVFTEIDLPIPKIMPGHVLIKVAATSVNPLDCKIRRGDYAHLVKEFPAILHGDVAGVITKVGADLTDKGVISPLVESQQFTFAEAGAAHHYLEQGKAIGKVVLENN